MSNNTRFLHLHTGELLIHLIILLLPTYLVRFSIAGLPLNALDVIIAVSFVVFLTVTRGRVNLNGWYGIIGSFAVIGAVSVVTSADPMAGLGLYKSVIILPMCVGVMVLTSRPRLQHILFTLSLLMAFVASIALLQWATGYGIPAPWQFGGGDVRVTSIFEYPNAVGLLLAPIIAMTLAWSWHESTYRNWYSIVSVVGLLVLFLAKTDGAIVAILAAGIITLLRTRWKLVVVVLSIVGLSIGLRVEPIRNILLFQDVSGEVRLALWQGTISMLQADPVFGSGLGGFPIEYAKYKLARHVELLQYSHNIALDFWAQLGIAGLIWLTYVLVSTFMRLLTNSSAQASVLLAGMVAIVMYGLVDVPYFKNDLAVLFWILITLSATIYNSNSPHSDESTG